MHEIVSNFTYVKEQKKNSIYHASYVCMCVLYTSHV